jgi:hypothetical protein
MKLSSGLIVPLSLVAFGIGLSAAARAQSEQRARTEAALMCLIGQAPVGCDAALRDMLKSCGTALDATRCYPFIRTRVAFIAMQRCNSPDGSLGAECPLGELQSVQYLGTQKSGYDVYEAKYHNSEETYVLSAKPGGEIHFHRFSGPPIRVMPSSMVAITAPANPVQVLFRQKA